MHLLLLLALLLLLQHLLDDLLLLNEERTNDAVADAVAASRTTVGALDGLLGLGDLGVLAGAEGGDLYEPWLAKSFGTSRAGFSGETRQALTALVFCVA